MLSGLKTIFVLAIVGAIAVVFLLGGSLYWLYQGIATKPAVPAAHQEGQDMGILSACPNCNFSAHASHGVNYCPNDGTKLMSVSDIRQMDEVRTTNRKRDEEAFRAKWGQSP